MKRVITFLLIPLLSPLSLHAETEISGPVGTETWSLANSPYIIVDDVTVMANETLTIEPGVIVRGDPGKVLWVTGTLIAVGTEDQPILLTRNMNAGYWDGVRIQEAGKPSLFEWCTFEWASTYHNHIHGGAVNLSGATATFRHCLFQYNTSLENASAIYSNHSHAVIEHCVFRYNDAGGSGTIGCDVGGTLNISYSVFYGNIADAAPVANFYPCDVTLDHITIADNDSRLPFTSTLFFSIQSCVMTNSIIQIPQEGNYSNTQFPFQSYSCIWGPGYDENAIPGSNLIFNDPLFVNPSEQDYRIRPDSPCVNAGDPNYSRDPDGTITDLGALPVAGHFEEGNSCFIPDITGIPGYPVSIPVIARFEHDAHVLSLQGSLRLPIEVIQDVIDIHLPAESNFNLESWSIQSNLDGDILTVALAGAHAISGYSPLFIVEVTLCEDAEYGTYPLVVRDMMVNEGTPPLTIDSGSLRVLQGVLGDVSLNGIVQAYDASMILQHLVGIIELNGPSVFLGDVSGSGQIDAEDAALILQYAAGSIDSFPVQGVPQPIGDAQLTWTQASYPGDEDCLVNIFLSEAHAIRSGELELQFSHFHLALEAATYLGDAGGIIDFVSTDTGARLFIANSDELTGEWLGWIQLHFSPAPNVPQFTTLNLVEGRLNDFIELNAPEGLRLQLVDNLNVGGDLPTGYFLLDNYPNPFNAATTVRLVLPASHSSVRVEVFDLLGRRLAVLLDGSLPAGEHTLIWRADRAATGHYLLRAEAGGQRSIRKMILLR